MTAITQQRCTLHPHREAVAHCPECHRPFCRECVTEHDDRIVCAACIRDLVAQGRGDGLARARFRAPLLHAALGFMVLWLTFYAVGQSLLRLPSAFHEGSLWRPNFFEDVDDE
ncbi:MAG: rhomboid family protein [Lentisphaerae bacterium]|nr:rhomboid family protein [Lentisphaerota bacterium]